ncbi:uncharacterized protein LOC128884704 isoform X2 [Hylaeus volcanicus]|uniref:uncharacterized protein LOC128884704 isoform X2 n=1 Tax=Hylaeus volcanicus TaxID=313075 RepID=UPI0023B7E753|nr:uncharacterized protein LOC128884704 isoform X2 [Hylaeus volcanicus]
MCWRSCVAPQKRSKVAVVGVHGSAIVWRIQSASCVQFGNGAVRRSAELIHLASRAGSRVRAFFTWTTASGCDVDRAPFDCDYGIVTDDSTTNNWSQDIQTSIWEKDLENYEILMTINSTKGKTPAPGDDRIDYKIMKNSLWAEENNIIKETQAGFRKIDQQSTT